MRKKLAEKRAQQSLQDKEDARANELVSERGERWCAFIC